MKYLEQIEQSTSFLNSALTIPIPKIAIMMGSGLSSITDIMDVDQIIPYGDIPHFPATTVQSHTGQLIIGRLNNVSILVYAGRWHYYEGYTTKELTLPIRVAKSIGIEHMMFTNVSGGVNPHYNSGDLILLTDHINMIPDHPLRGVNLDTFGVRFPDFKEVYNKKTIAKVKEVAKKIDLEIKEGVYLALQGPSLETPAEYKMIHRLGADMVGMSTVPEVIVAHHSGLIVTAISIISNECYPLTRLTETSIEEVINTAHNSSEKLNRIIAELLPSL